MWNMNKIIRSVLLAAEVTAITFTRKFEQEDIKEARGGRKNQSCTHNFTHSVALI